MAAALACGVPGVLSGQAPPAAKHTPPTPACALLSAAEVRRITGNKDYDDIVNGDAPGQGVGGGSSCQYSGRFLGPDAPLISLVLIPGKRWTAARRAATLATGCSRDTVPGLGDDAFFEACPAPKPIRSDLLYVQSGTNDLILQIDLKPPVTAQTARQTVIALAKAALANLR